MLPARRPFAHHRVLARIVPVALVMGGLSLAVPASSVPALAAEQPFRCDAGSLYLVQASGEVDRVSAATGAVVGSPVVAGSNAHDAGRAGALGVASSGTAVDVVGSDLVEHGAGAAAEPVAGGVEEPVVGAVDPSSGLFFSGSFHGRTLELHGYDLTTHTTSGPTLRVTVPGAPGREGDVAFDAAGHLYVVASSKKKAALSVASVHVSSPGSAHRSTVEARVEARVEVVKAEAVRVRTSKVAGPVTGVAFASDGYLYVSTADTLRRLDPVSGRLATPTTLGADVAATDLGSCAVPSLLSVRTSLPDGRVGAEDEFRATIRSAAVDGLPRALRPVGTTSGYTSGVQDQDPHEVAGPVAVLPGQTYGIASLGVGRADERRYVSTFSCRDRSGHVVAGGPSSSGGRGATGSVTMPTGPAAVVVCTISHTVPAPRLGVTQSVSPTTFDRVGQTLTFSAEVTNTGNVALGGLAVSDSLTGLPARTCAPVALGATLPPGASTTCTTSSTVTQADLDAAGPRIDRTAVSGVSAERLGGVRAAATVTTSVRATATPALSVTVATTPTAIAHQGQQVAATVTVRNTGNQTLRDVVATTVAPDLPALACAPVAQGGTLAPTASTVCTATRSSSQADLRAGDHLVSASAGGLSPTGAGVVATATTRTGVDSVAPKATDDAVDVVFGTPSVVLPASTNDSPGEPGGPAIDVSRTVFGENGDVGIGLRKQRSGHYGTFDVLADGSVRYIVDTRFSAPPVDGWTDTVQYRTYDVAGRSADAEVRVTYHRGLTARPDAGTALQGDQSVVRPLSDDSPGEDVDGTRATLDKAALRFTVEQPVGTAVVAAAGDTLTIPYTGTFTVVNGTVVDDPDPGWTGSVDVGYQALDSLGNAGRSTVTFTATPVVPTTVKDVVTTPYGTSVTLAGVTNDAPGAPGRTVSFGGFVGRDGAPTGATLVSPQGTWTCPVGGEPTRVTFAPAPGFVGVANASYTAQTSRGGTAVGELSATVQPPTAQSPVPPAAAAAAVDDVLTRPQTSYYLRVDPIADDRPGQNADGTLGSFDLTSVRFPSGGQPSGSQVVDDGTALLLRSYGQAPGLQLDIDATTGLISFYLPPRFRGTLPPIRYTVRSRTTSSTGATTVTTVGAVLRVRLVGQDPIATDDSVTVAAGTGTAVPGPSNDVPASRDAPIDYYGGTFPVDQVADLPKGSKVDFHGEFSEGWWEATVPGQGYWQLYWSNTYVSFTPVRGFVGTTSPLRYEITDSTGAHADALMRVTVLPPGVVRDDVASTLQGVEVSTNVLANDTPGKNADGTPVVLDQGPYFSSDSDQPKGSTIDVDDVLTVPGEGSYSIELRTGEVTFRPLPSFSGRTSPVLVRVGDKDSALRVVVEPVKPTAAPDDATARAGLPVRIAVLGNDVAGNAAVPLVPSTLRLRTSADLPTGSALAKDGQVLTVAGRGVLAAAGDGSLTFSPLPGVVGTLPPVGYTVADANGRRTGTTVTVRVTR